MSIIGICSAKGAPGVTTLATALALAGGAVLVEADAAGGDLALSRAIPHSPGLIQLAARARTTDPGRGLLTDLVRTDEVDGLRMLPAPVEAPAARAALAILAERPAILARAARENLVLDFGRLHPESPAWPLVTACQSVCLLVRGDLLSLGHAGPLAEQLRTVAADVRFALIDTGPYRADEAAAVLDLPCAGTVPAGQRPGGKRAARAHAELWQQLQAVNQDPEHSAILEAVNAR